MAITRNDFHSKFNNGDIPSHTDFVEIFDNFVNKESDKADFQMIEIGTDNEHYVTPALLRSIFQNSGILSGNCYFPFKEYRDNFTGNLINLENEPIENSVKVFKNGQLLKQVEDYVLNEKQGTIFFPDGVADRNIEVNYWYQNTDSSSLGSDSMFGKASIPFKENFNGDIFNSDTITLENTPLKYSARIYKNGQLMREDKDYSIIDGSKVITFSAPISNRNIEVDYWYEGPISLTHAQLNTKYVDLTTVQTIGGKKIFSESTESQSFIKTGGTPNQYLMADGSVSTSAGSEYDAGHSDFLPANSSGFQKFSNGLILQWAYLANNANTYSFPLTWPNGAYSVMVSTLRTSSGSRGYNHVANITKNNYYALIDGDNGYMFAIGY